MEGISKHIDYQELVDVNKLQGFVHAETYVQHGYYSVSLKIRCIRDYFQGIFFFMNNNLHLFKDSHAIFFWLLHKWSFI